MKINHGSRNPGRMSTDFEHHKSASPKNGSGECVSEIEVSLPEGIRLDQNCH
jgi:hypothetical protein